MPMIETNHQIAHLRYVFFLRVIADQVCDGQSRLTYTVGTSAISPLVGRIGQDRTQLARELTN